MCVSHRHGSQFILSGLTAVEVGVTYRGNEQYTLSVGDSPPIEGSSWLEEGDKVKGFVGDRKFEVDVAMVDRELHIFTGVSSIYIPCVGWSNI